MSQKIAHIWRRELCLTKAKLNDLATKLLKKPDQCRAVALCSNFFWNCEIWKRSTRTPKAATANQARAREAKEAARRVGAFEQAQRAGADHLSAAVDHREAASQPRESHKNGTRVTTASAARAQRAREIYHRKAEARVFDKMKKSLFGR